MRMGLHAFPLTVVVITASASIIACTDDGDSTPDSHPVVVDGTWETDDDLPAEAESWLDLPDGTQLRVVIRGSDQDRLTIAVTLGCSLHGGGAAQLDPVVVPEPTIEGVDCSPTVDAAERRLSVMLLSGDAEFRVADGLLVISTDERSIELRPV